MKKLLSVILAIVIVISCMPIAFASEFDFNDFYWTLNKFDLYRYNIYYPIEETIEGYEEYIFTDIGELMDAKLEIALQDYPSYRPSEQYFEANPEHLDPINSIFESIINEVDQKIASGEYTMVADSASLIIKLTELERQVNEDVIEFTGFYDILPDSTYEIFEEKFSVFNEMYEACSKDYTAYTYDETNAAAEDIVSFFTEIVECIQGDHRKKSYKDNGNGTHSMLCFFCGFESAEEVEHKLACYISTDFGLTINKCEVCDKIETVVDETELHQAGKDIYVRENVKFMSYQMNIYEKEEHIYFLINNYDIALIEFNDEITETFGSTENIYSDISKQWIDENIDKLPALILVFGFSNAMMKKAVDECRVTISVDTIELMKANTLASEFSIDVLNAFGDANPQVITDLNKFMDALNEVYPYNVTQEKFDELAAPIIETYDNIAKCLRGNHSGEYTDLGDGTHKKDCTFCVEVGTPEAHIWSEYVPNGDATSDADGTKTAACLFCSATDTVADKGSMLPADEPTDEITDDESPINFFEGIVARIKDFFARIAAFFKNIFA